MKMHCILLVIIAILPLTFSVQEEWWTNAVFYQIYPRSFKDNDNDGVGDLNGIISKLGHLKDLDITATWLSPIYSSPQVDQGYDISNYTEINSEYGTMDDFDQLMKETNRLGLKVLMDFVPNHTSDKHNWFLQSENGTEGYEDYYIWKVGKDNNTSPPNNWLSRFGGSAWEYSDKRKMWYLHQFAKEQPDLNYRSPKLVQEMDNVLKFWLDRGVSGFRVDAIPFLLEDASFADEPRSDMDVDPDDWHYLTHNLTGDQQGTYDMVYHWRELLDTYSKDHPEGKSRIMITEAYTDLEHTMLYYGNNNRDGAHFTFNFFLLEGVNITSNAYDFVSAVKKFNDNVPKKYIPNWVIGNHDNHRVATRFGPENVDGFNMLNLLLPGAAVSYNGEEIGQEDGEVTWEEGKDPSACRLSKDKFAEVSRDFERTPSHWDDTINAGFNNGTKPWLPVSKKYIETNLAKQKLPGKSHYKIYKQLVQLKKRKEFVRGSLKIKALSSNVIWISRSWRRSTYNVLINIGKSKQMVRLPGPKQRLRVVLSSVKSRKRYGDIINSKGIKLDSHESIVTWSSH